MIPQLSSLVFGPLRCNKPMQRSPRTDSLVVSPLLRPRGGRMKRRKLITLICGLSVAWPLACYAQQPPKVHRVAVVHPSAPVSELNEAGGSGYRAFFQGLRRLGYVEGRNLVVERYSAGGRQDRYAELARDVVRTNPDLIFAIQ